MARSMGPRRLLLVPWFVLAVVLAGTGVAVLWRASTTADARAIALQSSKAYFSAVVADESRRLESMVWQVDLILSTVETDDLQKSSTDGTAVDRGPLVDFERLGLADLPGFRAMVLWHARPIGSSTPGLVQTFIGSSMGLDAVERDRLEALAYPTSSMDIYTYVDSRLVAVVRPMPDGNQVMVVFDASQFLVGGVGTLSLDAHPRTSAHRVSMMLESTTSSSGDRVVAGDVTAMASLEEQADTFRHDHGDGIVHLADDRFVAVREIPVIDRTWLFTVHSRTGFFTIPETWEVPLTAVFGVSISLLIFAITRIMARNQLATRETMHRTAERFTTGFAQSPIGVAELDETGRMVEVNDALAVLLDQSPASLVGTKLCQLVVDRRAQAVPDAAGPELAGSDGATGRTGSDGATGRSAADGVTCTPRRDRAEVRYRRHDGTELWVHQRSTPVQGPGGENHTLVHLVDMTEEHRVQAELEQQASHDTLTGLPNRLLLSERLADSLDKMQAETERQGRPAVIFIDLDLFKHINDSLGHSVGDQVLVEVAGRLVSSLRGEDIVARFGGDEFVVVCPSVAGIEQAVSVAERMQAKMREPLIVGGRDLTLSVSIGVALANDDDGPDEMLSAADLAMYQAKTSGRNQVVVFGQEMRRSFIDRLALEQDLAEVLDTDQLAVFYQPLLNLVTNRIVGFEALVRWRHPTRGMVMPDEFLPLAAKLGMLNDLDRHVLLTALDQLRQWTETIPGADKWNMSVNASPENFVDPNYGHDVVSLIEATGVEPHRVTLEVTEQALLVNRDQAQAVITDLRRAGIKVAIDDFGTGYSSFSQVATLTFDVLKIDRSLIGRLAADGNDEIVRTLIEMAHSLGLATVAEGVETAHDLGSLRSLGSDVVQGHYIGRPSDPVDIPELCLNAEVIADARAVATMTEAGTLSEAGVSVTEG